MSQPIEFLGMQLAHRVINGSGTFDALAALDVFDGLAEQFPFAAFVSKTVTVEPRPGNPPARIWEQAGGMINSIGLPNKGVERYLAEDLPRLVELPVPLITNVMGGSAVEFGQVVERVSSVPEIAALELNVSCPNVKTGLDIGADPVELERLLLDLRARTQKPLIVKLTPNTANVALTAKAAEAGGADSVSLINTLRAMAVTRQGKPWLGGRTGGLSGPAVRHVALAQVDLVANAVNLPIVGMGGVQTGAHAKALIDVGATVIAVGTESFRDPLTAAKVAAELH